MAKIMIMDDDIAFAFWLADDLRNRGHETKVHHNPLDARQELKDNGYDVLITDIVLESYNQVPSDGGLVLIAWRKLSGSVPKHLKDIRIIAVSGAPDTPTSEPKLMVASRLGADVVCQKSWDLERLSDQIAEHCAA